MYVVGGLEKRLQLDYHKASVFGGTLATLIYIKYKSSCGAEEMRK
jgi:hypothetical protein